MATKKKKPFLPRPPPRPGLPGLPVTAPMAEAYKTPQKRQTPKMVEAARRASLQFQQFVAGRAKAKSPLAARIPRGQQSPISKTPRAMQTTFAYINAQNMAARASTQAGRAGPFVTRTGAFGWTGGGGSDDGY